MQINGYTAHTTGTPVPTRIPGSSQHPTEQEAA
ncbi:hypothetical protein EDF71_10197 [Comamonas sp. JUb58]|nr:hypothetical protein EDF71_10197 [Comamonas sp. JUb58]